MRAWYNENDSYPAKWLRRQMARNWITHGTVEERSIEDVRPQHIEGITRCHFFAGFGGWEHALAIAGWPYDRPVWTGSCPCQPFSVAGQRKGLDDERHLWPAWFSVIDACRPSIVFGEQTPSPLSLEWIDIVGADLEGADYAFWTTVLGAHSVGAPHRRMRIWFVAIDRQSDVFRRRAWVGAARALLDTNVQGSQGWLDSQHGDAPYAEASAGSRGASLSGAVDDAACGGFGREFAKPAPAAGASEGVETFAAGAGIAVPTTDPQRERWGGWCDGDSGGMLGASQITGSGDAFQTVANAGGERWERGWPEGDEPTGEFGDVDSFGLNGHTLFEGRGTQQAGQRAMAGEMLSGFWRGAEWILCTDGKARCFEPGSFPLADGLPKRAARLCSIGNAVVPQTAAIFISTVMDGLGICAHEEV